MSATPEQTGETLRDQRAREAYFTASQRQLVWARFKKQRAAMTAATVLIVLIISGLLAPFLSPYDPTIAGRNKDYMNGAPNVPMFCDKNGCSLRPFLHTIERERSIKTIFRWVETINEDKRRYVQFLVQGSEYKLLGFIPAKTHLFGIS
ncbi:MAG: ABC transporter permease, partial [Pseudomonadota bacterium]|nr:ABC transporter permease [Pseudomonadota bacterium]